jgi:RNA polymerase sigma factor (sigma-70 family)
MSQHKQQTFTSARFHQLTAEAFGESFSTGGFRQTLGKLRRCGANPDLAQEIAQAAWVRGWERLDQLQDHECLVQWVTSIAIRMFWDVAKGRRITPLLTDGFEPQVAPSVNLDVIDIGRVLDQPQLRNLINAVYVEGRSAAEVAVSLGISIGAVHHRLSRARAKLRRLVLAV